MVCCMLLAATRRRACTMCSSERKYVKRGHFSATVSDRIGIERACGIANTVEKRPYGRSLVSHDHFVHTDARTATHTSRHTKRSTSLPCTPTRTPCSGPIPSYQEAPCATASSMAAKQNGIAAPTRRPHDRATSAPHGTLIRARVEPRRNALSTAAAARPPAAWS